MDRTERPTTEQSNAQHLLSAFIRRRIKDILDEWERSVRTIPRGHDLDRPALIDRVPDLLDRIAAMAEQMATGGAPALPDEMAERHALHRLAEGVGLRQVVVEYGLLRDTIIGLWQRDEPPTIDVDGVRTLNLAIDRAIAESVDRYLEARDRATNAVDRVASAALESTSLDQLLKRLLEVVVETTPSIDTAAILIRENNRLRIRATIGFEEDLENGFMLEIGEGFVGTVAARAEPQLLHSAATDPLIKSPTIRSKGVRALYGIPLVEGQRVIGVAHVGSLEASDFSPQDKAVVAIMANRATAAIYQHLLREHAEHLAEILEHGDACFVLDSNWRLVFANQNFKRAEERLSGHRVDNLLGRPCWDLWPNTDGPQSIIWRELHRAIDEGVPREFEYEHRQSGSWWAASAYPTGDHGLAVFFREITERRLLADISIVLSSTSDYRVALQKMAELVVPALADWCVVDILRRERDVERVAIVHSDPLKVELAKEYAARYPPDWNSETGVANVLRTGQPEIVAQLTEAHIASIARNPEHARLIQELGLSSYIIVPLTARNRVLGALGVVSSSSSRCYGSRDLEFAMEIGRRCAVAIDNALLYDEAQRAVRYREDILAIVSHDLKNPLGAIHLAAGFILSKLAQDPRTRSQTEIIHRSATRMNYLIRDLLDMASIQAGRLAIERKPEPIEPLVAEAAEASAPAAIKKGINIRRRFDLDGRSILCDRVRILQVFGNLLGNAIKFGRSDDVVTVTAESHSTEARFGVIDTGPGISAQDQPHIFEPYWSGAQRRTSTGLGLFISRGIIESHGGKLWVESKEGEGSAFYFTLPITHQR